MINQKKHSYQYLLRSPSWIKKRDEIIQRDAKKWRCCQSTKNLEVHHRQYHFIKNEQRFVDPWEYHNDLLITFCEKCHRAGHKKYGEVPIIYMDKKQ